MTKSESQFRSWFLEIYPYAMLYKLPDFKASGRTQFAGLPDYLYIGYNEMAFIEIKTNVTKTPCLYHFTPAQQHIFPELLKRNVTVWCSYKTKDGWILDKKSLITLFGEPKKEVS